MCSGKRRIDVPRIGRVRQAGQPIRDVFGSDPINVHELLALAESGVESLIAKRDTTFDTGERDIALDRRELERQRLDRARQPLQRFQFETFDVDLDEGWL